MKDYDQLVDRLQNAAVSLEMPDDPETTASDQPLNFDDIKTILTDAGAALKEAREITAEYDFIRSWLITRIRALHRGAAELSGVLHTADDPSGTTPSLIELTHEFERAAAALRNRLADSGVSRPLSEARVKQLQKYKS